MKSKLFITILGLAALIISSCSKDNNIKPSSNITTREYNITGYNQLRIEDAFQVQVDFSSDEEQIIVEANDNLFGRIIIEKNLNELIVKLADNTNLQGNPATLKVYITTDHLFGFRSSGASSIILQDTVGADSFEINLSGASIFQGTLLGGNVNALATGASIINLKGTAGKFTYTASGASIMQGYDFVADWLHTDLEGASMVSLTVNNKLDVWASGASSVYYKGDGIVNIQELSGASQIIKVE